MIFWKEEKKKESVKKRCIKVLNVIMQIYLLKSMKQNLRRKHSEQSSKNNVNAFLYQNKPHRNSNDLQNILPYPTHNQSIPVKANTTYVYRSEELYHPNHDQQRLSTSMTIRSAKQKLFSPWNLQSRQEKPPIKWVGVQIGDEKNLNLHNFAFPKRKQKRYEQSLSNFLLKYGKYIKKCERQKAQSKSLFKSGEGPENIITNAATTKLKVRATWFERKKPSISNTQNHYVITNKL